MKINKFLSAAGMLLSLASAIDAAPRTSANYSISSETLDGGGARLQSATYRMDASVGGITGMSAGQSNTVKHGYVGRLYDFVALSVTGPSSDTLDENASRQLQAVPVADDLTTLAPLDPASVVWSVVSGPIASISSSGLVTADFTYQDTAAALNGTAQGLTGQWNFTILNVGVDNYGSYAADGLDDAWQVQYFGEDNANAGPTMDPDGDGQNNRFEFIAGLVPTDASSVFRLRIEDVADQPDEHRLIFSPRFGDRSYSPQFSSSLLPDQWAPLIGSTQTDNGDERTVTDSTSTDTSKFYRIEITKP